MISCNVSHLTPTQNGAERRTEWPLDFFGLGIAAALFYWIFEVEDNARRRHWLLRELPEVLTGIVCFVGGHSVLSLQERGTLNTRLPRRRLLFRNSTEHAAVQDIPMG